MSGWSEFHIIRERIAFIYPTSIMTLVYRRVRGPIYDVTMTYAEKYLVQILISKRVGHQCLTSIIEKLSKVKYLSFSLLSLKLHSLINLFSIQLSYTDCWICA